MHKCDQCDKSFPKAHGLKVHKSRMHSNQPEPAEPAESVVVPNNNGPRIVKSKPKPQKSEKVVRFCPDCGCNIQAIQMALNL